MTRPENPIFTPIYLKTQAQMAWPEDPFFYLLTADGLFVCRNHKFFRSCVPARRWPSELARQEPHLKVSYPQIPRAVIERIVGFFSVVAELHNSEAGVLLAWDERAGEMHVVVPDQVATVSRNWRGETFPIGLKYEWPSDLPPGWVILGDVHSHVDYWPNPSYIDDLDESYRAGVHMVVGRIYSEPPEFHIEAVVDGQRFTLRPPQIMEPYQRRRTNFPKAWLKKLKIKAYGYGRRYDEDEENDAKNWGKARKQDHGGNGKSGSCCTDYQKPDPSHEKHAGYEQSSDLSPAQLPPPEEYPDPAKDQG